MATKISIRRKRDAAAGKVRKMQTNRAHIRDTPPRAVDQDSWVVKAFARNRAELNRPAGGALHYRPKAA